MFTIEKFKKVDLKLPFNSCLSKRGPVLRAMTLVSVDYLFIKRILEAIRIWERGQEPILPWHL